MKPHKLSGSECNGAVCGEGGRRERAVFPTVRVQARGRHGVSIFSKGGRRSEHSRAFFIGVFSVLAIFLAFSAADRVYGQADEAR